MVAKLILFYVLFFLSTGLSSAANAQNRRAQMERWVREFAEEGGALPVIKVGVVKEVEDPIAENANDDKDSKRVSDDGKTKKLSLPKWEFLPINKRMFDNYGYMSLAEPRAAEWSYFINRRPCCDNSKNVDELLLAANVSQLDLVLQTSDQKTTKVLHRADGELNALGEITFKTMHAREVYPELEKFLGFNGIVLARKGDKMLVITSAAKLKRRAQGIIISDSVNKIKFPQSVEDADALVELIEARGKIALFKVVIATHLDRVKPGAKIKMK